MTVEGDIHVEARTRPLWLAAGAWASMAVIAILSGSDALRLLGLFATILIGPTLIVGATGSPMLAERRRGQRGTVEKSADKIVVTVGARTHTLPLASLDGAWREGNTVVLSFRGKTIVRITATAEAAGELLEQVGFARALRTNVLSLGATAGGALSRSVFGFVSAVFLLGAVTFMLGTVVGVFAGAISSVVILAIFAMATTAISMLALRPALGCKVIVGTDGVRVRRGLAWRYLAFSPLLPPSMSGRTVLVDGSAIPTGGVPEAAALLELLQAYSQPALVPGAGVSGEMFDRENRSRAEWVDEIKRLATKQNYRNSALDTNAVAAIAENPNESPERRAAAALALASAGDAAGIARVRVAAQACALPKLRVALEHAIDGDLDTDAIEAATRVRR